MRISTIAVSTLAALAAGELAQETVAHASPDPQSPESATEDRVVSAVASSTTSSSAAIASPEAVEKPEFSSTPVAQKMPTKVVETTPEVSQPTAAQTTAKTEKQPHSAPTNEVQQTPMTNDLVVTATDVRVVGGTEELQQIVLKSVRTRLGGSTSQSQLQNDVAEILNTGLFTDANVSTYSHADGWDVVYEVQPVVVRSLELSAGAQVLTPEIANEFFQSQFGKPISPTAFNQSIEQLSRWYEDNGYVLAQVLAVQPNPDGILNVEVAEGVIGEVNVRFIDEDGEPAKGRTRKSFVESELQLEPGQVFRLETAQQDVQQLYRLGLFDYVDVSLNGDARRVDVTYELMERPVRAINGGGGYNDDSGIFGTVSYDDQNFGGVNQKLGVDLQLSLRNFEFESNYGSPYRASNPDQPGYNVNVFRRRGISQTFDEIELPNGDRAREGQFGSSITLSRPVNQWDISAGLNYTRTRILNRDGQVSPVDEQGNRLSFSDTGIDDLVTLSAGIARDQRDNSINPTSGSILSFSTEQSVPIGNGSILMNRLQANYSQYIPINLLGQDNTEVLAFNIRGGTTIGDLPPYQAFNLGGINSVRGYGSGDVGSGRSYVLASAEYRIPILSTPLSGVLFADFASDLGSGDTVPGEPGVVRDKPGTGFGYGAGLRVNSPLGVLRADFGFNNQGESRLQFGIGQQF